MTCSHTSYTFTLVHTTDLVPWPWGHALAFLLFNNMLSGVYFAWHASKYFWRPVEIPPLVAYIIDVGEMFLWQAICYSFGNIKMFLAAFFLYGSLLSYRLFYKNLSIELLRNAKGGDYCNFYKS